MHPFINHVQSVLHHLLAGGDRRPIDGGLEEAAKQCPFLSQRIAEALSACNSQENEEEQEPPAAPPPLVANAAHADTADAQEDVSLDKGTS